MLKTDSTSASTNLRSKGAKKEEAEQEGLLKPNQRIRGRWLVGSFVGEGEFSELYRGYDLTLRTSCFIKIELYKFRGKPGFHETLPVEQQILLELGEFEHFPKLFGSGQEPEHNFIVTSLCGRNMNEILKYSPVSHLSIGTTVCVGLQVLDAIQLLHDQGYIHRDIRPAHIAMGKGSKRRTIYLLDYHNSRRYVRTTGDEQIHRNPRENCELRGCMRYASLNVLQHQEAHRGDDLWSLLYSMLVLLGRKLPWHQTVNRENMIRLHKQNTIADLCEGLPTEFQYIGEHLSSVKYGTRPDYEYIKYALNKVLSDAQLRTFDPYDWENNFAFAEQYKPQSTNQQDGARDENKNSI